MSSEHTMTDFVVATRTLASSVTTLADQSLAARQWWTPEPSIPAWTESVWSAPIATDPWATPSIAPSSSAAAPSFVPAYHSNSTPHYEKTGLTVGIILAVCFGIVLMSLSWFAYKRYKFGKGSCKCFGRSRTKNNDLECGKDIEERPVKLPEVTNHTTSRSFQELDTLGPDYFAAPVRQQSGGRQHRWSRLDRPLPVLPSHSPSQHSIQAPTMIKAPDHSTFQIPRKPLPARSATQPVITQHRAPSRPEPSRSRADLPNNVEPLPWDEINRDTEAWIVSDAYIRSHDPRYRDSAGWESD